MEKDETIAASSQVDQDYVDLSRKIILKVFQNYIVSIRKIRWDMRKWNNDTNISDIFCIINLILENPLLAEHSIQLNEYNNF